MGDNKDRRGRIIGIVCIVLIILDFLRFQFGPQKVLIPNISAIPPRDKTRKVKDYNWETNKWEYKDEENPRAKAIKGTLTDNNDYLPDEAESDDEDYIREYLEEHVDGFKEDNYWGNEYEINNKKK